MALSEHMSELEIVCPGCRESLRRGEAEVVCDAESIVFPIRDGIPELLLPAARERVARFLAPYLAVRHGERWTDDDARLLLALPYDDTTGRHSWMWRVRARGFEALVRAIGRTFGARRLRVCERGAGVAWLSYRLALAGHDVLATDVNTDGRDGLGAARHYVDAGAEISRAAAEADRLPLRDASVDLVVDAATFHYAVGRDAQAASIREAARVLAPGGMLAILDSPVYSSRDAGERMLAEWRAARTGPVAESGYLVRDEIVEMLRDAGLAPSVESHWMGWRWTANYVRHRALGPREPARLPLVLGRR